MGIPRLTSHLEPFQHRVTLGCSNNSCPHRSRDSAKPRSVVIDGPGLAYWVYYKLVGRNSASSALEAQPSYRELGAAVISSLHFLEICSVEVKHVFFDGALPISKREVRVQRLTDTLTKLNVYRGVHSSGFKAGTAKELKLRPEDIFYPWTLPTFTRNLPSGPFLVPAVFEALKASEFADRTQLVPGEADGYLAAATRISAERVCLTGDSDLAIHNLGAGAMAFFTSLEASSCSTCNHGHVLVAKLFQQEDLLARLGAEAKPADLIDLGYELFKDSTLQLAEIVRRIKSKASAASKARAIGWTEGFGDFAQDYLHPVDLDSLLDVPEWCQQLDNRTSELVVKALFNAEKPWHNYVLPMIEDPERGSAWMPSLKIRQLAYSVLVSRTQARVESVVEVGRSGRRISEMTVPILLEDEVVLELSLMHEETQQIKNSTGELLNSRDFWIVLADIRTYRWYCDNEKIPPGPDLIRSALGEHKAGKITWQSIHLRAQIQGVLFSMRMLNQILMAPGKGTFDGALKKPTSTPEILPIRDIILNDSELAAINLARYATLIVGLATGQQRQDHDAESHVTEEEIDSSTAIKLDQHWEPVTSKAKKKAKRKRAEPFKDRRQVKANQNPFDMLR